MSRACLKAAALGPCAQVTNTRLSRRSDYQEGAGPRMYTYIKYHEGEIASEILPTDRIGAICFDGREVRSIGWALLASSGDVKSGTIDIDRSLLAKATDPVRAEVMLYRGAARALNRKLANAVIDRRDFVGEPRESKFYRHAGISPSWRWSGRGALALVDRLTIELKSGLGFQPFLPVRHQGDPEVRAKKYLEDYRHLRACAQDYHALNRKIA